MKHSTTNRDNRLKMSRVKSNVGLRYVPLCVVNRPEKLTHSSPVSQAGKSPVPSPLLPAWPRLPRVYSEDLAKLAEVFAPA